MDQEVKNAEILGHLTCIQMDSNAKLGPDFIKGDPHNMSGNGQLLSDVIISNNLIVCNGTPKCEGLITRERQTVDRLEQSIIDFLIVCPTMFSSLQNMKTRPYFPSVLRLPVHMLVPMLVPLPFLI